MKLFSSSLRPANHSISSPVAVFRERQLSLEDDYLSIIQAFEPESIMAEQASENNNLSSMKYFSFLASFGKLAYLDLSNKPLSQP